MASWPGNLPSAFRLNTRRINPRDDRAAFQPEVGPPLRRRRSSLVLREFEGQMTLTDAQVTIFETFYNDTLEGGTLTFTMDDPTDGLSYTWSVEAWSINQLGFNAHTLSMTLLRQGDGA